MSNQPPERRNEKVDSLQIFVFLGTKNAAPLSPEPGGDLPGFIGPMISRKWRAPGSLLRLFERTVPA
jgi:hypothetical protein